MKKIYTILLALLLTAGVAFADTETNDGITTDPATETVVDTHAADTSTHGVGEVAGTADITTHSSDTTSVHGIPDTSAIGSANLADSVVFTTVQSGTIEGGSSQEFTVNTSGDVDTIGTVTGGVPVVTDCGDGETIGTGTCGDGTTLYGGFIEITTGTLTLPAVGTGMWMCIKTTTAAAVHVDPNASDRFVLDGVALDDGDKLSNTSTIDDTICFYADSAAGWKTLQNPNGWTDGG
jgi:hypothetical protein